MMKFGGSYFRNDVRGLGAPGDTLPFADQALLTLVQAQPSLVYTEWASQVNDSSWQEVTPTGDYQAYAINDFQLVSVANSTSSEVQSLAVISPFLTRRDAVQAAFEGTPFSYVKTEAIYAQADPATPPTIFFLYWLALRDSTDPKIGPTSLVYAATLVGGVLSYILQIPAASTDRAHPSGNFMAVLSAQLGKSPIAIPSTPAQQTTVPAPGTALPPPVLSPPFQSPPPASTQASAIAPTSGDTMKALLLVGLGATAAIVAYRLIANRKQAS